MGHGQKSWHPAKFACQTRWSDVVFSVLKIRFFLQVVAVLVLKTPDSLPKIKNWIKEKLPSYSVPSKWKLVTEIPRNTMGKVNKKELVKTIFPDLK